MFTNSHVGVKVGVNVPPATVAISNPVLPTEETFIAAHMALTGAFDAWATSSLAETVEALVTPLWSGNVAPAATAVDILVRQAEGARTELAQVVAELTA